MYKDSSCRSSLPESATATGTGTPPTPPTISSAAEATTSSSSSSTNGAVAIIAAATTTTTDTPTTLTTPITITVAQGAIAGVQGLATTTPPTTPISPFTTNIPIDEEEAAGDADDEAEIVVVSNINKGNNNVGNGTNLNNSKCTNNSNINTNQNNSIGVNNNTNNHIININNNNQCQSSLRTQSSSISAGANVVCDIDADVRLLRTIGFIASRVRYLAKLYGDFKLVNPYTPAKQRKQLQDIILRHSINEEARAAAAAAVGLTKIAPSRSLTPASSNTGSYCQLPTAESYSTREADCEVDEDDEGGIGVGEKGLGIREEAEGYNEADVELLGKENEQEEEEEEEHTTGNDSGTAATSTAVTTTVQRKSSVASVISVSVSASAGSPAAAAAALTALSTTASQQASSALAAAATATAAAASSTSQSTSLSPSSSILLLEDLLIQFYEDRCSTKLTIMSGKTLSSNSVERMVQQQQQQQQQQQITTTTTTITTMATPSSSITTVATTVEGMPTGSITPTNDNGTLPSNQQQQSLDASGGDGININNVKHQQQQETCNNYFNANMTLNSSQQHLPRHTFLQPSGHVVIDDNLRRRRASDCSPLYTGNTAAAAAAAFSNQLQITLKNNNCTAKFPFHRGSCGGAGEHLLAANSIANRATIILSKSCSNVDGGVPPASASLFGSTELYASATGGVEGVGGPGDDSVGTGIELDTPTSNGGGGGGGGGSGAANLEVQFAPNNTAATSANGNNEYSILQLNNTIIQCHFNDDDFRALVKDLKRKVEYTERMNWLCLSKRPFGPTHRKSSLPKHKEVKKRFLEICDTAFSDEVKAALRLPAFDSYEWGDADVIHLMQTMFLELGFIEKFSIPVETLREWLYEVYKHYNEVPFHNFRHCFCVAQMMYAITRQANLLNRLGDLECLILLVSCICHDLDHPGYNNIYQINARTELALRYNDISPLENHHCSIAFRLLEHPECNIFKNFSRDTFNQIREGIIRCILATDMARHNEILTQFKEVTPTFDYTNRAHINLLCMILIKVADISNEARPMDVAEPWLDRLLQEFFAQSAAEKSEGLPVTPFMDPDKVSKPGSQVRFIGLVLLPLFEALGDLVPELNELIIVPVRLALEYYKRLNDAQTKSRKSVADSNTSATSDSNSSALDANATSGGGGGGGESNAPGGSGGGGGSSSGGGNGGGGGLSSTGSLSPQMQRSQSSISNKSRRSIPSQKTASRTSVDEPQGMAAELHDLPEGSESGDSETATEVDVAEKTSKFKVDTEGSSNRSKSSHSTSRKSSREKRPSMIGEMCSSGGGQRIRNSYGNIHGYHSNRCHFGSNRAVSLDQYSSGNRRLSDGLQQVISDSNVFYSRHTRSGAEGNGSNSVPTGAASASSCRLIEDLNMNATEVVSVPPAMVYGQQPHQQLVPNVDGTGIGTGIGMNVGSDGISPNNFNTMKDSTGNNVHASSLIASAAVNATASNGNVSPTQPILAATQNIGSNSSTADAGNGLVNVNTNANAILPIAGTSGALAIGASTSSSPVTSPGTGAGAAAASSKSSWKSRFKQFSDYFSFSFDKGTKRFGNARSSPCSMRNNNANNDFGNGQTSGSGSATIDGKQGLCCTISNNLQASGGGVGVGGVDGNNGAGGVESKQHDLSHNLTHMGRHRAYSLDVQCSMRSHARYSSSSTGGGDSSRKSSRHDGIGLCVGGGTSEDHNNSNNTLHSISGADSDMPICLPPPIRIGSVDATETMVFMTGAARVNTQSTNLDLTPATSVFAPALATSETSKLSMDLSLANVSSSDPIPKI